MKTTLPIRSATTLVALIALSTALLAPDASARAFKIRVLQPAKDQIVSARMVVRVKTPARSKCQLTVNIDGKRAGRQPCGSKATQKIKVTVSHLKTGRHKIRVTAARGAIKQSRVVAVRVVNQTPAPNKMGVPLIDDKDFDPIFVENFDKPAALGTWGTVADPDKIGYVGSAGTKWVSYPQTYLDTYDRRPYRSDGVLSVHDGFLDYWLHNVGGQPAGANPSPLLDGVTPYQTYGRYSARLKVDDTDLSEYYMAWLLWPKKEADWSGAESDYPEGSLSSAVQGVEAFTHIAGLPVQSNRREDVNLREWHTYTQTWTPIARTYAVDGDVFGISPTSVYSGPERWQLQTETRGNGTHSGHLLVDWAAVYSYAPK